MLASLGISETQILILVLSPPLTLINHPTPTKKWHLFSKLISLSLSISLSLCHLLVIIVGESYDRDHDQEIDDRFLVAASTVFLSMSLKIITEIVEYVRRNPEIVGIIDRELNKFMVSTHKPTQRQSY